MAASRELPRLCSWLLSAFIASKPASPDGATSCWPIPPLTRTCTGAGEGCTNEGASPRVIPRKFGFGPRADLIAGSTAQAQGRHSSERQRPAIFRRLVSRETLSSHHAAAVYTRPTHQWGIQRSCEGTRRPGAPAPPTRGANSTCRWRAHAAGQRQCGLALLQPKGMITGRAVAYGSLCWMRRRIWRFSSVIRISSRLRYSLFRLFPKLHRQADRGMSSRKAKRAALGADARRAAMPAERARWEGLQDDHTSPRALSLPHAIEPGSEARGGRRVRAAGGERDAQLT